MEKKNYYTLYKDDLINCPFCGKTTNLFYSKVHTNRAKCKKLQSLLTEEEKKEKLLLYEQHINSIKSKIKYDLIT